MNFEGKNKQPLNGGRVTKGLFLLHGAVHRPKRPNSAFVAGALAYAHANGLDFVPEYLGEDEDGNDMFSFIPGEVPTDLGEFSDTQLCRAAELIRRFHTVMRDYVGDERLTVCHNDLSPCNFTFVDGMPSGIIDFDACAVGEAEDDLAYALWMWLDIGNADQEPQYVAHRFKRMRQAYDCELNDHVLADRILKQISRVEHSVFADPEQTQKTAAWARSCAIWLKSNLIPLL